MRFHSRLPLEGRPADRARAFAVVVLFCLVIFVTGAVKVFYSLASSRLDAPQAAPTPSAVAQASAEESNAFLAVLDPSLAPPPPPPAPPAQSAPPSSQLPPQNTYSYLARLSAPVWVQLMGKPSSQEGEQAAGDGSAKRARPTEYGMLTLKTCLSAICISR